MKLDLAVIGQGAVTPAGIGVGALRRSSPPSSLAASLSRPDENWPVLRVDPKAPELLRWLREPRLRRASSITIYLVEAAAQALAGLSSEDRAQTGLIIAFSAGCLAYSRRFLEEILHDGQNRASPALFPETVFNSPGSHVAAVLGLNGAAYALVGDETAWIAALRTASVWLRQERVKRVLVLGAEEFDPLVLDAYQSARWLRRSDPFPFLPSEGAGGLLLKTAEPGDERVISLAHDGYIYRNPRQAACAARALFSHLDSSLPCYRSAAHTWLRGLEASSLSGYPGFPQKENPYLGQAFTASAAWDTLSALAYLVPAVPQIFLPLWGLNHQLGALRLEKRA